MKRKIHGFAVGAEKRASGEGRKRSHKMEDRGRKAEKHI